MIFSKTYRLVIRGQKTQTRRIYVEGKSCRYTTSRIYTVQPGYYRSGLYNKFGVPVPPGQVRYARDTMGNGWKHWLLDRGYYEPHIQVTRIHLQDDVRNISSVDVASEGFSCRGEFLDVWEDMHPGQYKAWVIEFKLV